MEILYLGAVPDSELEPELLKLKFYPYSIGGLGYIRNVLKSFSKNNQITAYYLAPFRYFENKKLFFARSPRQLKQDIEIRYFWFINLPVLQECSRMFSAASATIKWIFRTKKKSRVILMSMTPTLPIFVGTLLVAKLFRVHVCTWLFDLPDDLYSADYIKTFSSLKKMIFKPYLQLLNSVISWCDSYLYVSPKMGEFINKKQKPEMTLEGVIDTTVFGVHVIPKKRALLYAGSLHRKYGIDMILKVFSLIQDPKLELWICGAGEMAETVKAEAEKDRRIKFFGFVSREEAIKKEQTAQLLINLRDPKLEYTKRSFPGKTFEYMASGTPFFTTKTEGILDEYYQYLYYTTSYNPVIIKDQIEDILEKSQLELDEFAAKAKEFVIARASSDNQTKRVINFFQNDCRL